LRRAAPGVHSRRSVVQVALVHGPSIDVRLEPAVLDDLMSLSAGCYGEHQAQGRRDCDPSNDANWEPS
jgi:hypothetical protein